MSNATYAKYKTWAEDEDLTTADLNAYLDNERNNLNPQGVGGYSDSVSQMQKQTTPGSLGTESMALSSSDELERLRYVIARLTGLPFWYQNPTLSIEAINTLLRTGVSIPNNRIESGRVRTDNNQPVFLQADGTAAILSLKATTTNFKVIIQNTEYVFTADTQITGMSLAPSTGNTATVLNGLGALADESVFAGEADFRLSALSLTACGTAIVNLVGKYAAFKVVSGGNTEYFIGYVNDAIVSGAGSITKASRGYFFDNADSPVQATALTDTNVVTLMKLFYIFAKTDLTITSTANQPTYSAVAPGSPGLGDYWFNVTTQVWNVYNGTTFINANATLIGMAITDTAGCKASRSFDFFAAYKSDNTLDLNFIDGSTLRTSDLKQGVNVKGNPFFWDQNFLEFDMPAHLTDADGSTVEAVNTQYYLYITDTGQQVFSTIRPYFRIYDLSGKYHRYKPWRCVGQIMTEGTPLLSKGFLFNSNQLDDTFIVEKIISPSTNYAGVGQVLLSASSGGSSTAAGPTFIGNMGAMGITCRGKPISLSFQPQAQGGVETNCGLNTGTGRVLINRAMNDPTLGSAVELFRFTFIGACNVPPGLLNVIDYDVVGNVGIAYYGVYIQIVSGGGVFSFSNIQAIIKEVN